MQFDDESITCQLLEYKKKLYIYELLVLRSFADEYDELPYY